MREFEKKKKRSVVGIFLSSHFVNDRQSGMEKEN